MLVAGAVLGGLAIDRWSQAQSACPDGARCPDDSAYRLSNEADTLADLSTAAFVTGGAGLAGATILWLAAPSATEPRAIGVALQPSRVVFRGRW